MPGHNADSPLLLPDLDPTLHIQPPQEPAAPPLNMHRHGTVDLGAEVRTGHFFYSNLKEIWYRVFLVVLAFVCVGRVQQRKGCAHDMTRVQCEGKCVCVRVRACVCMPPSVVRVWVNS